MLRAGMALTGLRPLRVVAVLCLALVAFVAAFHSMGLRGTMRYPLDVTVVYGSSDDSVPSKSGFAVEACHICTAVAVPDVRDAGHPDRGHVPSPLTARLVSVLPKVLGPPPKA